MDAVQCQSPERVYPKQGPREEPMSFEQIYRRYHRVLCRYAEQFTHCSFIAEEIVSEVFVKYWKHSDHLHVHTSVYGYLRFATRNQCIDHLRQKNRNGRRADELSDYIANDATPSDLLISSETQRQIDRAIDSLSHQCRQIFRMSREANMTYAEIAAAMQLSVKTVEAHMGRSLKQLRERLLHLGTVE